MNIRTEKLLGRFVCMVLISLLWLTGCATARYKPESFGPSKKYAIVSIVTLPETIDLGGGSVRGQDRSASGLIKAISKDSGYSNNSDIIFKDTLPLILKEFHTSKNFTLLPEENILKSKTYADISGDEPKVLWQEYVTAEKYKYLSDKEKLSKLARHLKVEGVVTINLTYGFAFRGVGLFGLVAAGYHHGVAIITVSATDKTGDIIWRDMVRAESDDSIGAVGESVNFKKLHPLLKDVTVKATKQLLERLKDKVS